jgi:hypothetical protein
LRSLLVPGFVAIYLKASTTLMHSIFRGEAMRSLMIEHAA